MTWALGPTTGVVEAIDSQGKPFSVGPPELPAAAQQSITPQSRAGLREPGTILTDDEAEDVWRQADPVPARAHFAAELEPAMPAWPRSFNWWPFFALLSLIFGAIGLWHLWAVLS